jgi:hypothetical protein
MKPTLHRLAVVPIVLAAALLPALPAGAHSLIEGLTGTNFGLTIKPTSPPATASTSTWGCAEPAPVPLPCRR